MRILHVHKQFSKMRKWKVNRITPHTLYHIPVFSLVIPAKAGVTKKTGNKITTKHLPTLLSLRAQRGNLVLFGIIITGLPQELRVPLQ